MSIEDDPRTGWFEPIIAEQSGGEISHYNKYLRAESGAA
jgi:hypothetical protein